MKAILKLSLIFMVFMTLTAEKCSKKVVDPLLGTWDYIVSDTPQGDVMGKMVFANEEGVYTGTLIYEGGESPLDNLKVDGNNLSFSTDAGGYAVDISGAYAGEAFEGTVNVEGYEMPIKATKNSEEEEKEKGKKKG